MNYSAFYDDVLADCARCPLPVVLQAVRLSVRELCDRSRIWVYDTTEEPAVANLESYDIDVPANTEVVELQAGYFSGRLLQPKSADELDRLYGEWQVQLGGPVYVTSPAPDTARPVPYPDTVLSTDTFRWRVAIRPTLTSTSFDPDALFCNDFYEDIVRGAKARLMLSPQKPYTNLKLAEIYARGWMAAINRARIIASRSRTRGDQRIELPRHP